MQSQLRRDQASAVDNDLRQEVTEEDGHFRIEQRNEYALPQDLHDGGLPGWLIGHEETAIPSQGVTLRARSDWQRQSISRP